MCMSEPSVLPTSRRNRRKNDRFTKRPAQPHPSSHNSCESGLGVCMLQSKLNDMGYITIVSTPLDWFVF